MTWKEAINYKKKQAFHWMVLTKASRRWKAAAITEQPGAIASCLFF